MKSKTSLFNKGVFIHNIKTYWWISLINLIILFFVLPFNHLNILTNLNFDNHELYKRLALESLQFKFYNTKDLVQLFLIFIIPVIVGAILFGYKNNKKSTTFYHSLPISKKSLFTTNLVSGFLIFAVPIVINSVFLILINAFTPLSQLYNISDVLIWMVLMIVSSCVMYGMTIFIGMFTGITIVNILLTYIIYAVPAFIQGTLQVLFSKFIFGFSDEGLNHITEYIPFYRFLNITGDVIELNSILIITLFAIIVTIGSYYLYKKYPLEEAGNLITFDSIKPVFKYCVTLCSVLLGSVLFMELYNENIIILIISFVLFSALGYFITQALIDRTIKVGYSYKGYIGVVSAMSILMFLIFIDPFNYVSRVPALNEVEEASIYILGDRVTIFKEEENISNLINLHDYIINSKDEKDTNGYESSIGYKLKNGKYIKRNYYNVDTTNDYIQSLLYSYEYKNQNNAILTKKIEDIKIIEIYDERNFPQRYIIRNQKQIQEIVEILREDILNITVPIKNAGEFITLEVEYKEPNKGGKNNAYFEYFPIDYMTNVMNYIKEHHIYDEIIISQENIDYAIIEMAEYYIDNKILMQNIIDECYSRSKYYKDKEAYLLVEFYLGQQNNYNKTQVAIKKDSPIVEEIRKQNINMNVNDVKVKSVADVEYANIITRKYKDGSHYGDVIYRIKDKTLIENILEEADSLNCYFENRWGYLLVEFYLGQQNNYNKMQVAIKTDSPIIDEIDKRDIEYHGVNQDIFIDISDLECAFIIDGSHHDEILYRIEDKTLMQDILNNNEGLIKYYENREEYLLVEFTLSNPQDYNPFMVAIRKDSPLIKKISEHINNIK